MDAEEAAAAEALVEDAPQPPPSKSRSRKKAPPEPKAKAKKAKKKRKPPKRKKPGVAEPESVPVTEPETALPSEVEADVAEASPVPESTPSNLALSSDNEPIAFETVSTEESTQSDDVSEMLGSEVLDSTEPSPESALDIDDEVVRMLSEPPAEPPLLDDTTPAEVTTSELTDTTFGRAVESFVGESTGDLVEDAASETPVDADTDESPVADEKPLELTNVAEPTAESPLPVDESTAADQELPEIDLGSSDAPEFELNLSAEQTDESGVPSLSFDEDSALDVLNEPTAATAAAGRPGRHG